MASIVQTGDHPARCRQVCGNWARSTVQSCDGEGRAVQLIAQTLLAAEPGWTRDLIPDAPSHLISPG